MRKLILLAAMLAAVAAAQDARTRAYIHAVLKDSAEVMRETIKDTADVVREEADTDDATLYGAIRDTVDVYWGDSIPIARAEMTDSAEDVWNDSIPVARGEFYDSAVVAVNDSTIKKSGLGANWAAGDFDITGLEKCEADTIETQYIKDKATAWVIDSFKVNAADDTLFIFIAGSAYCIPVAP